MGLLFAILFWLSLGLIIYHLFGYPLLLAVATRLLARPVQPVEFAPFASVIIPAHNEGGVIKTKLLSVLGSRYPSDRLEVICVDDGSSDDTVEQVLSLNDPRIILDLNPERSGKMVALNRGAKKARSDYLVFTDANAMFKPDTLAHLMSNFADARIGCVSGRKVLMGSGTEVEANENLYWRYESWIKTQESRLGSTTAATGELLAVRRAVYTFPAQHIINDDFQIVLRTIEQGYRVVYDSSAVTVEAGSDSMADEYSRKSRIAAGRWQLAGETLRLAPKRPGFTFMFLSHKLLRLLVMPLMILAFIGNLGAVLAYSPNTSGLALIRLSAPWGQLFLAGQVLFYFLAGLGALLDRWKVRVKPLYFLYFFVSSQFASLAGLVRFKSGRQTVLWRKVAR